MSGSPRVYSRVMAQPRGCSAGLLLKARGVRDLDAVVLYGRFLNFGLLLRTWGRTQRPSGPLASSQAAAYPLPADACYVVMQPQGRRAHPGGGPSGFPYPPERSKGPGKACMERPTG